MTGAPTPPQALRAGLPDAVNTLVLRLLDKSPERRYRTASGLAHDLRRLADGVARGEAPLWPLGEHDRVPVKELPQRLVGRDAELGHLSQMYQKAAAGEVVVAMLAGPSGIGKSSLAQELQVQLAQQSGVFVSGKHDQLQRHEPFMAFRQAIDALVRRILKEPEGEVASWRRRIQASLGGVGSLLLNLVPGLERLVGPQKKAPELAPQEAENCLLMVLQRFVQALTARQPLVLFLDDLQWADAGTLKLLSALHRGVKPQAGLLLLGGYRDNEVPMDHPLARLLTTMREDAAAPPYTLLLAPLDEAPVVELLVEASGRDRLACRDLARVLHAKSGGNPYFLRELVRHLWDVRAITPHPQDSGWQWQLEALEKASLPDSVASLVGDKLQALPAEATQALGVAGCLGNLFTCDDLAAVLERSIGEVKAILTPALLQGLLTPVSSDDRYAHAEQNVSLRFAHDKVQQAAYALLPEDRVAATHLHVGQHLRERLQPGQPVFEVLNHLNRAVSLLSSAAQRKDLAALNGAAAQAAMRAGAYALGADYGRVAVALLDRDAWADHYETMAQLSFARAECEYLAGDPEVSLATLSGLTPHLRTPLEKADALRLRARILAALGRHAEAMDACEAGLRLVGHPMKLRSPMAAVRGLLRLKWVIRGRSLEALVRAPRLQDANVLAALALLRTTFGFSFMLGKVAVINCTVQGALMTLVHGNSMHTANSLGAVGALCSGLNDYATARLYADAAMQCLPQVGHDGLSPVEALFIVHSTVQFIDQDVGTMYQKAQDAHTLAVEHGDPTVASYFNLLCLIWLYFSSLPRVDAEHPALAQFRLVRTNADYPRFLMSIRQAARCLMGKTLGVDSFLDAEFTAAQEVEHRRLDDTYPAFLAMVFCVHRAWEAAAMALREAKAHSTLVQTPGMEGLMLSFYGCIILIEQARAAGKRRVAGTMRPFYKKLTAANAAGSRYRGHGLLIAAELQALRGAWPEAGRLYRQAMDALAVSGRVDARATGYERAARFYLAAGAEEVAALYLTRARELFAGWGARAKVLQLEQEFATLLEPQQEAGGRAVTGTHAATQTNSSATAEGALQGDMPTLMRVSQAIASEVALPTLVQRILEGVGQISGATRSVLLLPQGDAIEAVADTTPGLPVPMQVVHYAMRMREAVALQDTRAPHDFRDPALEETEVRSLVCVPVLHQGSCKGALYLESHVMTHAFATRRLAMVEMLAAQAAIALENARTYTHLEEVVADRTEQLRDAHDKLVKLERDATEIEMAGGFAHEVRNALAGTHYALESLMGDESQEQVHDVLALARRGIERSARITEETLNYAQVAQLVVKEDQVSLATVVDAVLQDMSNDLHALNIACAVDVPSLQVRAQETHAFAMVRNLISNARDALSLSDPGLRRELQVRGRVVAGEAVLEVQDNGAGMTDDVQARIFRPFFSTKGAKGRGLGLGLSRKLAQAYHGDLRFTSRPKEGSTFQLRLPLA